MLRGQRARFAFGALVLGWVVLAGLHVLNPDAFIARVNLGRAVAGQEIRDPATSGKESPARGEPDVRYLAYSLSADAVPELFAALPQLSPENRRTVSEALLNRWAEGGAYADDRGTGWRSWNWSNGRARRLVRERRMDLMTILPSWERDTR